MDRTVPSRRLTLLRHGRPTFPGGEKLCIGSMDLPLSEEGILQARALSGVLEESAPSILYCSPALRCRQTAQILSGGRIPIEIVDGLHELNMGAWEGLTFAQIRLRYPELYRARGEDPENHPPPGGETFAQGRTRFQQAISPLLEKECDVWVVSHAGVNRLYLASLVNLPAGKLLDLPQPYGCLSRVLWRGGTAQLEALGEMPMAAPDAAQCGLIRMRNRVPPRISAHCDAVARKAVELTLALEKAGIPLNRAVIEASALLHDIARPNGREHPKIGARLLFQEGYPQVARVIASHHCLMEEDLQRVTEETVVFLADKLIEEDHQVTLSRRFERSREKCGSPQSLLAHAQQFDQAFAAQALVERTLKAKDGLL